MKEKRQRKKPRRGTPEEIGEKPWWQSVGVLGGIISLLAPIVAAITNTTIEASDTGQLAIQFAGLAAAIGGIMAIVGRIRARGVITK